MQFPDPETIAAGISGLLLAGAAVRKYLQKVREENRGESAHSAIIHNLREEVDRLAALNLTLHNKVSEYQKEILSLHDKITELDANLVQLTKDREEMKTEMVAMRDRLHGLFSCLEDCGNCSNAIRLAGWTV